MYQFEGRPLAIGRWLLALRGMRSGNAFLKRGNWLMAVGFAWYEKVFFEIRSLAEGQ